MILDKIRNLVDSYIIATGNEPLFITMNPKILEKLKSEIKKAISFGGTSDKEIETFHTIYGMVIIINPKCPLGQIYVSEEDFVDD